MRKPNSFLNRRKFAILGSLLAVSLVGTFIYMFFNVVTADNNNKLRFPSEDGLMITADTYIEHNEKKATLIVMFHQASWSRGEYIESAKRFNELGYNCLAVDLRSGKKVRGVENETARLARERGKTTRFVDAYQDVMAALSFAKRKYNADKIIALGSSYSAGLVLKVAGEKPYLVNGVMAFSPGEYFEKEGKPHDWVMASAKKIKVPVFITSARKEKFRWEKIYESINTNTKFSYIPVAPGKHGSRALWSKYKESEGYWRVVETFLKSFF